MAIGGTNGLSNGGVDGSTDAKRGASEGMEDTVEYRVMMAYATRRRPGTVTCPREGGTETQGGGTETQEGGTGVAEPQTPEGTTSLKRKKRRMKWLKGLFSCGKPQTEKEAEGEGVDRNQPEFRSIDVGEDAGKDRREGKVKRLVEVADRLTRIADGVSFSPGDLETDGENDSVEKLVGLLLREHGDRLTEEILKDTSLAKELFGSYSFFDRVVSTFLSRIGLNPNPSTEEPKTQIAVTCEVSSRLSALDTLPMNRLLGFGSKYLKSHFSPWVMQKGGYEEVFQSEDDTDEEDH